MYFDYTNTRCHLQAEREYFMANYNFFQNKACEYFPCHKGADPERFSCLFCYCPLYALGENCGGSCTYTDSGIKDCSSCLRPHIPENYEKILERMGQIQALARRK